MVRAERWARVGEGSSRPSSKRIMKSTHAVGFCLRALRTGAAAAAVDGILFEDFVDLFFFVVGAFDDFVLFAQALGGVVLGVSAGGEVSAEAHGDGAGGDLGEAGEDDDVRGGDGSGEAGGEGEGDGEAVGEADDDVADGGGGLEVAFYVGAVGTVRAGPGGGSVAEALWATWCMAVV